MLECLFSWRELPEMKADSLHPFGDFALLVCQNAMQAMNVTRISSRQRVYLLDYAIPERCPAMSVGSVPVADLLGGSYCQKLWIAEKANNLFPNKGLAL
jgi:hypothetical protein